VQYQYTSRQLISTASLSEQGPVSLVNANLGFKIWRNLLVEGWVQNLFNRTYFTQSFPTPLQTGDENGYLGAPRTYGLRLRATF
jgi:outer membrane receptor protein involved in Fe transport